MTQLNFFIGSVLSICVSASVVSAAVSNEAVSSESAPLEAPAERVIVLSGLTLIDGTGAAPQSNVTIVIRGARIAQIIQGAPGELPENAELVDASGAFAVPGLTDLHTHLATDPSGDGYQERVRSQLRELLGRGITQVRDMGGDGRVLSQLAQEALFGELPAPDIYFAALIAGPPFFSDRRIISANRGVEPGSAPWARSVTMDSDLDVIMAEIREFGSTGIKAYSHLEPELLNEVVTSAKSKGLKVWSHWVVDPRRTGALDVIRSGVEVVSHAFMLMYNAPPDKRGSFEDVLEATGGMDLFTEMKKRGTILDATLIAGVGLNPPSGYVDPGDFGAHVARLAREHGVMVATGSDAPGDGVLPAIHLEYGLLVEKAGFSPLQVIESATRVCAKALGLEKQRGTLEVGKEATLILLPKDPTQSIANLAEPTYVIKRGVVYSGENLRDHKVPAEPLTSL